MQTNRDHAHDNTTNQIHTKTLHFNATYSCSSQTFLFFRRNFKLLSGLRSPFAANSHANSLRQRSYQITTSQFLVNLTIPMAERSAFVTPNYRCCSLPSIPRTAFTCRKKPSASIQVRNVARRQRLRATATPPKPDDAGGAQPHDEETKRNQESEKQETDQLKNADDTEASDLALPNLRELFDGAGKPDCEQCNGKGEISCPVCNAKGFITLTMMDTTSSSQCRMCRGQRIIPCPTCRELVYKSVLWWDQIPSTEDDPNEDWRQGPDGPRISWGDPPAGP